MNEVYQSLIRAALKILVGYLVAKGFTDDSTAEKLTGLLAGVIAIIWGMVAAEIAKGHREIVTGVVPAAGSASVKLPGSPSEDGFARLPVMLLVAGLSVLLVVLTGCQAVTQHGNIVSVTQSVVGLDFSQDPSSATPHMRLGFVRSQFHVVPTGSNLFAPAVISSMDLNTTFSQQSIAEDFATGGATRDLAPDSPAKTAAKAKAGTKAKGAPLTNAPPITAITNADGSILYTK